MRKSRNSERSPFSASAKRDLLAIGKWAIHEFGEDAALRYHLLIMQGVSDLAADPERLGSIAHSGILAEGIRTYHIQLSRARVAGKRVVSPRHILVYREGEQGGVFIIRILHDARLLTRALPAKYRASP